MSALPCDGCGTPVEQHPRARRRKWCTQRCRRQTLYSGTCVDCGAPTAYTGRGVAASERCVPCGHRHSATTRKIWTREVIIAAIRDWAAEYGEPPAAPDWSPTHARLLNDEARARRFEAADGRWPTFQTPIREFGSWNAAIAAAGFEPRPVGGGGGNGARHRSVRDRVAA